jgi:hypothetical protein
MVRVLRKLNMAAEVDEGLARQWILLELEVEAALYK